MKIKIEKEEAEAILNQMRKKRLYSSIVREFRYNIGLKRGHNGFRNKSKLEKWQKEYISSKTKLRKFDRNVQIYTKRLYNQFFASLLLRNFEPAVTASLLYAEIPKHLFEGVTARSCKLLLIKSNKNYDPVSGNLFNKKGLYIYVNPLANPSGIKKTIDEKADTIRKLLTVFKKRYSLNELNIDKSPKRERNEIIGQLWELDHDELALLGGGENSRKDIQIENIMKLFGEDVTYDNVRRIAQRQKDKSNM